MITTMSRGRVYLLETAAMWLHAVLMFLNVIPFSELILTSVGHARSCT